MGKGEGGRGKENNSGGLQRAAPRGTARGAEGYRGGIVHAAPRGAFECTGGATVEGVQGGVSR